MMMPNHAAVTGGRMRSGPHIVTVDFASLEDKAVTIRTGTAWNRSDPVAELVPVLREKLGFWDRGYVKRKKEKDRESSLSFFAGFY